MTFLTTETPKNARITRYERREVKFFLNSKGSKNTKQIEEKKWNSNWYRKATEMALKKSKIWQIMGPTMTRVNASFDRLNFHSFGH